MNIHVLSMLSTRTMENYENSEYTGNRNFTKTRNGPERKFWKKNKKIKKFIYSQ
jgi:hypothetical protein